jgi:hypothetical protein
MPALIPQPNGRGALLSGGKPGNKGGGNIKTGFREGLRGLGPKAIQKVEKALDGKSDVIALKAVEVIGKYGYGEPKILVEEDLMTAVMDVAFKLLEASQATAFMEALDARLRESA